MIPLLLSIASSSLIFVIFKLFSKYKVDTFQAIVFNYFTAFVCGTFITSQPWSHEFENLKSWGHIAFICSGLFISLFLLMGKSSQLNGVARTSVAVKMSMAVSILAMVVYYNEPLGLIKICGIILAFCGVVLVSKPDGTSKQTAGWMLFILFFGSGLLDFLLNFVQNLPLTHFNSSMFTAFGFLGAGVIGLTVLSIQLLRKKTVLSFKNVIAGVLLGIPNYFSIYMLIEAYRSTSFEDSTILSITNVAVVVLSSLVGFSLFKEKMTTRKTIGLLTAIFAIIFLFIAQY